MRNNKRYCQALLYVLSCTLIMFLSFQGCSAGRTVKIGIVGGGIGGTSCAHFLKTLFGSDASIDVYEPNNIGGRLSTALIGTSQYEEGGSIIHPRNKYMVEFLKILNLKKREPSGGYFGLYDGKEFVFSESNWQALTLFSVLYRYGFGIFKLRNYIDSILNDFTRIYELQEKGVTFENVTALLQAMDEEFKHKLQISTQDGFKVAGISQRVIDELVTAALRVNYGQDTNVHQFVGMVSVAGAGSGLWAVKGGNFQIPKGLLQKSGARLIQQTVKTINRLPNDRIIINDQTEYDIVIVAAPQTSDMKNLISFTGFNNTISFPGTYHQTVCSIIKGNLKSSSFPNKTPYIDEILTINDTVFFNSVSRIYPASGETNPSPSPVWKVFSQNELSDSELDTLFTDIEEKYVKDWLAYPHYDTSQRVDSFILDDNLYHINAIEWAASAMEMSVIGAKNVALLAFKNHLIETDTQIPTPIIQKDEL